MAAKHRGRAGGFPPARPMTPADDAVPVEEEDDMKPLQTQEDTMVTRTQAQIEGVTVIGEALRRVSPDSAEFVIEVIASATTAAQALRDNHAKTAQVSQAVAPLGVQAADLQTISLNVYSLYAPVMPPLLAYAGAPQIGAGGDVQFGSYHAKNTLRVNVREPARVGEIADAAARAGASIAGSFSFRASDESGARKSALEAAGKDARSKAEALAAAAGRQAGEAVFIAEDIIASNGALMAMRAAMPFAFGAGAPQIAGELEYYARVSATFRLQ